MKDSSSSSVERAFLKKSAFYLKEDYLPKIKKAVSLLSTEEIWWRPNAKSNSIGNLALHLSGNVRQWIICGLGQGQDRRQRDEEFTSRDSQPPEKLINNLEGTVDEAAEILLSLSTKALLQSYQIQGFSANGVEVILHVVEHFSHHAGQILYITKMLKDVDLKFWDL